VPRTCSYLDHPGPIPFAHRGGALDAPENSLEAFGEAVDLGFRYLETDVHVTADGVLVALHDDRLDRVSDRSGPISELSWAEVRKATIGDGGTIPRLDEVLTAWPDTRLNVDPKSDAAVDPLVALLRRLRATERVCVGSFSDARIQRARQELGDGLCTGMGPRAISRLVLTSRGLPFNGPVGDCAQVPASFRGVPIVTERFIVAAHEIGVSVHVWTVDDPVEMHRLLDLGVDGLMTDRPIVLRDTLVSRGDWYPPTATS
jgi:glycerophosphoryl diester phosphodiesterase